MFSSIVTPNRHLRPHTNVVQLFGISSASEDSPPCIVTEFCPKGNLLSAFWNSAEHQTRVSAHASCMTITVPGANPWTVQAKFCRWWLLLILLGVLRSERVLSLPELTRMAKGAAAGMVHLHAEKVIHRDFAARNLLLTGDMVVKVAGASYGIALR